MYNSGWSSFHFQATRSSSFWNFAFGNDS